MAGVSSCMKYTMFIFNFLFWVCGCIILGVSIWLRVSKSAQGQFNIDSSLYSAVDVLIAVGSIIMVLGFLGCCGAMKESKCMLLLFFIGLLIILLLQIAAGVLGGVYKNQVQDTMKKALSEQIKLLQSSAGINKQFREEFHKFEIENKCCGVLNGVEDWGNNKQEYQGCACEKQDQGTDFCKGSQYKTPCSEVILELIKKNMIIVMGVAFGLAFIEILGMVFSMILYCQIQNK